MSATAASPIRASSSFWLSTAVPPAMATSPPVRPAEWANTASIATTPMALTPREAANANARRLWPRSSTILVSRRSQSVSCALASVSSSGPWPHSPGLASSSSAPAGSADHWVAAWPAATSAWRTSAPISSSNACSLVRWSSGAPLAGWRWRASQERTRPIPDDSQRPTSPTPTNSCQERITSPRRKSPPASRSWSRSCSAAYARSTPARRAAARCRSASRSPATSATAAGRPARAPRSAWALTAVRAAVSADRSARAVRTGSMADASRPSVAGSRAPSTTPSIGRSRPPGPAVPRPASSKRRRASASTAPWSASRRGSRFTTTSSGTPLALAWRRNSQGT